MENCDTCTKKNAQPVPYAVYEIETAKHERTVRMLIIALLISIVAMVATNLFWIYEWTRYDYSSEETVVQQDGSGTNIIGNSNEVTNDGSTADN